MNIIPTPLQRARLYEKEHANRIPAGDRPLFHLTPPVGWMNDPNGFCYYQGQYHMFYQYHPYSTSWGPMHWGHAVSHDLLHWTYLPCALAPDTAADAGGCFSGSAVPMPDGQLLLAYTGVQPASTLKPETQAQCIAVGNGIDFVKSSLNPVVQNALLPDGFSEIDFRDPKVWLDSAGQYCMAVGCRHLKHQGTILLLKSPDALHWTYIGELDRSCSEYGMMWECPDFFSLDGRQVLIVSPQEMHAREEFHAGYGTVALLGTYDEARCAFTRQFVQPVDFGLNFYAPQTVLSPDGRRIMIGWMENWETCKEEPRRHSWYTQMSAPRELFIRDNRLMQRPVREIEALWQSTIRHDEITIQDETELPGIRGRLLDMMITLHPSGSACRRFVLDLAKDNTHYIRIRVDLARGELIFDRSHGGSHRDIVHTRHVPAEVKGGILTLRLLLDKESVELFINEGERVVTSLIHTPLEADGITFAADAPLTVSVEAHPLRNGNA